jgi:rhodanese-related sulfurtransferase
MATPSFVHRAIEVGRPGTKMEPWKDKLTPAQIDDVTAFIFDGLAAMTSEPQQQLPAPTGKGPLVINPSGAAPKFSPRSDPCPPDQPKCPPNNRYVPAAQVAKALAEKRKMIIIDARPASDWMRVHVTGAVSIPHHDPKRLDEIVNDGTWILAYCACPHHLSGEIVDMLRAKGFKNVAILDEGILEWHRLGYPVVAAPGVTPPPKQTPQ